MLLSLLYLEGKKRKGRKTKPIQLLPKKKSVNSNRKVYYYILDCTIITGLSFYDLHHTLV